MSSLRDQIAKDVKEIKKDNKKHFGTKLPGNDNKEQEQTEQDLTYSQMIMGSLASLVWGKLNVKDDATVKSLLGNKNNIYNLIEDIKYDIEESNVLYNDNVEKYFNKLEKRLTYFDKSFDDIYNGLFVIGDEIRNAIIKSTPKEVDYESYLDNINTKIGIANDALVDLYVDLLNKSSNQSIDINISGDGFEKIKNLLEQINTFNFDSKDLKSFNGLYNLIDLLSNRDLINKENNAEENLTAINTLLNSSNKNSLRKILEALDKIVDGLNINADLESLSIIIDTLITIITIDKEKINDKGLKELVKITSNGGLVELLLEQLSTITDKAQINEKNIIALGSFFESIAKVGDIGLIKRYKIKSNLKYFSKFITKDIPEIFEELVKVSTDSESEDKLEAMSALGDFFLGIVKIAEIDNKQRKQLKNNLEYIKYNLLDALTGNEGIITLIIKSINEASKDFSESTKSLTEIFDKLFKIADFSFKDLVLMEIKLSYLSNIFKEQITGGNGQNKDALIPTLLHIQGLKFIKERIDVLQNTFDLIKNLFNILPSLKDILLSTAKLKIIDTNFRLYDSIINDIDSINIDDKLIEKVEKLVNTINSINKLTNISIGAKLSSIGLDSMISTTEKLKAVIDVYHDIDEKDIKKALDTNKQFTKLIMVSAAILIAGTLLMGQINIGKLVAFTAALTFFTFTIALTYKLIGKHLDDSIEIAESFIHLMALSSLILLVGAFFTRFIDVKDLFAFTYVLSAFLLTISGTFLLIGTVMDDVIDIAKDITELIKISAAMLMIGGLYMKLFGPKDAAAFAILLGSFILGIVTIFTIASKFVKGSLTSAKEFSYLIAISTLSLILGALFISNPKRALGAMAFAIVLGGFIFGIVAIFKWVGKDLKLTMATALAITVLVGVSALILLIGGLFMKDLDRAIGAIAFALLLDTFIGILLYTFKKNSNIAKAIPVAVALGIVTIISSIALLTGGWLIMNNTDLLWAIPAFGVILWGFTEIMCKALSRAAKNAKDIYIGASIMAILGGLVFEMGFAFRSIIKTSKMIDDWEALIYTVALMGGVLLGLFGLAYLIANSGAETVGMIALATAIIAALIGCVALMGIGIQEIAKGIEDMAKVSHMDVDLANLAKLLVGLAMLTGPLMGLSGLLIPIGMGAMSMKALRVLLSDAAFVVQSYASLTIPMYDENGKFKGFKQMSESDIDVAMDNVKLVVTSLFDAIKEVYDKGKPSGMFKFSLTSLLTGGGGTIFGDVAVAGRSLSRMLSELAISVKQWCDLKIPIYKGDKIIGYKTLDDSAFKNAGENIKKVVSCLGEAVLDVYNYAPDKSMFDYQFGIFGDSPFEKVSKSLYEMGKMLSSVAVGVKEWSDLRIPIYKGTEVVGYQTLGDGDFLNAALNIYTVLTCIGNAIVNVVKGNDDIFGDDIFTDGPAIVAAKAMKLMGETLNLTALAVASYASGEFPIFDKDGKIIDKLIVNEGTITNAKTAIQNILECIGNAIVNVIKNDKNDIFDDGVFSDSPAVKAAEAIKNMSDALNNTITAIQKISKLNIKDIKEALDPNGKNDNVYHKLSDILKFTVDIYKLFAAPDEDSYGTGFWGGSLSFAEYLDKNIDDIEDANEALETFTKMLSKMISNYSKIGKIVLDNQKSLAIFKSGKDGVQSPIYKYLDSSLITVSSIIKLLSDKNKLDLFEEIEDNEKDITKGIKSTSNICITLLNNILKTKKLFDSVGDFKLTKLIPVIRSFNSCIKELNSIGKQSVDINNKFNISLPDIDARLVYDKIKTYSLALNTILKIAEYSKNIGEEGYNTLRDGILTLSAVTEKIHESEHFKNHTNDLKNYIKTINSIDLSKLMNLQLFVNSLNTLSRRLGNLDNLTDAIANKLSAVLFELVKQLTKADASINNAHQLQEKRKKLIEESMDKISNLMSQHMIVEITQVDPNSIINDTKQTGSINGNSVTNNEGYHPNNSNDSIGGGNKLQSPENVGNDKQVNISKRSESDLDEFKRWMINEYTNDLVKKIKQ